MNQVVFITVEHTQILHQLGPTTITNIYGPQKNPVSGLHSILNFLFFGSETMSNCSPNCWIDWNSLSHRDRGMDICLICEASLTCHHGKFSPCVYNVSHIFLLAKKKEKMVETKFEAARWPETGDFFWGSIMNIVIMYTLQTFQLQLKVILERNTDVLHHLEQIETMLVGTADSSIIDREMIAENLQMCRNSTKQVSDDCSFKLTLNPPNYLFKTLLWLQGSKWVKMLILAKVYRVHLKVEHCSKYIYRSKWVNRFDWGLVLPLNHSG